jgi:cytochrome b6
LVGHTLLVLLRGGEEVTGATLSRFFGIHVAVLPGLTALLILLHLALVQRFGMSLPPGVEAKWKVDPTVVREMKFVPNFLLREVMAWYIALGVLGTLAALLPWELGTKADPFGAAPAGIRPEWYFMFMFQTLKLIPSKILHIDGELLGIGAFGLAGAIWVLLPFLEGRREKRGGTLIRGAGIFALCYIVAMTIYGYLAK